MRKLKVGEVRSSATWNLEMPAAFSASVGSGREELLDLKMAVLMEVVASLTRIGGGRPEVVDEEFLAFFEFRRNASRITLGR